LHIRPLNRCLSPTEERAVEERERLLELLEAASHLTPLPEGPPPLPRCAVERPQTRVAAAKGEEPSLQVSSV